MAVVTVHSVSTRGFKALKQIVKLHYKLGDTNAMLTAYRYVQTLMVICG